MRYYSSNARETAITSSVDNGSTTIQVDNPVGYPANVPFEIQIDPGLPTLELCLVTSTAGNVWTVQRGFDGSTPQAHLVGARVVHGASAIDFKEPQDHMVAVADVHGIPIGSSLVGTNNTQTLTNKTLSTPTLDGATFTGGSYSGGTFATPSISDFTNAQHNHSSPATGGVIFSGLFFPRNNQNGPQTATGTSFTDLAGSSITFTAPSAWPPSASGIVWNLTMSITIATSFSFYIQQVTDSTANPFLAEIFENRQNTLPVSRTYSLFTNLPSAGVAHTSKWRFRASDSGGLPTATNVLAWGYLI